MTAVSMLPSPIRTYLYEFVLRSRVLAVVRGLAVALAGFAAWMLIFCVIDRFVQLHWAVRLTGLLIGVAAAMALLLPRLVTLTRPADLISAAAEVEREDPRYGQRLLTVTSRLLGAAAYRGSDQILIRLTREVGDQVAAECGRHPIRLRGLVGPLSACLVLAMLFGVLARIPLLGFTRLAARFIEPLADVPPVTTTTLQVRPGDCDATQSQGVTLLVHADRLGDSPVTLYLSGDDREWTRLAMSPGGNGSFSFKIPSVDRDLRYYVTGGDARSRDFAIRVLRAPAISQFRISYDYPGYTRLPTTTVINADGHIEGPAGTRVRVEINATEPLQSAVLRLGDRHILMDLAPVPSVRQASFVIGSGQKYAIDLISARNVTGSGPLGMSIQAIPDLPPQVRLARGGDSIRISPREIVPVWYEALDDYGIKSLQMRAQVNGQSPVNLPVELWGDPRRQQDKFELDLATLPLTIGDVVQLAAVATDTAGHVSQSLPLRIIISPRSIDLDQWERIGELRAADQLCRSLLAQFEEASKARAAADAAGDHPSSDLLASQSRADRALSAASQTATLLRQSLLRATTHSRDAGLSVALAAWVDAAEVEAAASDEGFRLGGLAGGLPAAARQRLAAALNQVRAIQPQITAVEQGQQADAVLADYENLQAARKRPVPADEPTRRRLRETMERMRQDIAAEAGQIGLDGNSTDLEGQLGARLTAGRAAVASARPIDFAGAARRWAEQIRKDPQQRLGFEARLSAAAQAEALRPDADLGHARDLELASRAAAALASLSRGGRLPPQQAFDALVSALGRLPYAHRVVSEKSPAPDPQAQSARQDLRRLSEDPLTSATRSSQSAAEDRQKDAESLALQASAAAAERQYGEASKLDQAMVRRLEQSPRAETTPTSSAPATGGDRLHHQSQRVLQDMATARTIDDLGRRQDALAGAATGPAQAADQQRDVADQIGGIEKARAGTSVMLSDSAGNGRDRAASEVLGAQDQLSAMPKALAAAQAAAAGRREAAMRAAMAVDEAKNSPPDQRVAADRAVSAADQNAQDATGRLHTALEPISSKAVQSMAGRLEPFAPETDEARASLLGQLAPALDTLGTALRADDAGFADRRADEARRAMETCQRDLAAAQDLIVQRDPLVAARWYAKAAAESLSMIPPDVGHARAHQADASMALSRAWDQSIHKAASERLASLPALSAVLSPPPVAAPGKAPQQGSPFVAAREWGRMRPQDGSDLNTSMHEADPPGFEASLKLYFEALGKVQDSK